MVSGLSRRVLQRWGRRRAVDLVLVPALVASAVVVAVVAPAGADTSPSAASGQPATVTADVLPTVQINDGGVVWSTTTIGSTTYATGNFTQARPAGAANGVNTTNRGGLLAFDVTTGVMTSWNHTLNGAGRFITPSPDGATLYVGGDFTTVDGQPRGHLAAFDVATGALKPAFAPAINGSVLSIAATNSTVYAGGSFSAVNGTSGYANLVSLSAADGSVNTAFSANTSYTATTNVPTNATVTAMTLSPDGTTLVVGGRFTRINDAARPGIGGVDVTTGAPQPWSATWPIRNNNSQTTYTSMRTVNGHIYASGYTTNFAGNFEGTVAFDKTGTIEWLNSCHGDTYDLFATSGVVYTASHWHDCSDIGAWEETTPRTWHRGNATTATASPGCTVGKNDNYNGNSNVYFDYSSYGFACPSLLPWDPDFAAGTATGANQGPWSVSGNNQYVVMGGEFPTVNGVNQYGLVRFAVPSAAPKAMGPIATAGLVPNVTTPAPGTARVSWQATWDRDNENLTYKLYRGASFSNLVYSTTVSSRFWSQPTISYTDTGASSTTATRYHVTVVDPDGNVLNAGATAGTVLDGSSLDRSAYARDVTADGASSYWRFDQASGASGIPDLVGSDDMTAAAGVTPGATGVFGADGDNAMTLDGSVNGYAATQTRRTAPSTYSMEFWFKTSATTGGRLMGFGSSPNGVSGYQFDRQVYLDASGYLYYGVNTTGNTLLSSSTPATIKSATTYNDNQWHHVVATLGSAGMTFYADGKVLGRQSVSSTWSYPGYWRVGADNLEYWPGANSAAATAVGAPARYSYPVAASVDEAAVYPTALSLTAVQRHYTDSGRSLPGNPPSDSYGATVYGDGPDLYYRADETAGTTAQDASGNGRTGTYSNVTLGASSPVVTGAGTAASYNGTSSNLSSATAAPAPTSYSEEAWFATSSTTGGKIIGFQSTASGTSGTFDRIVALTASGQVTFGVQPTSSTSSRVTLTSPSSYNDGKWHHVVATQSAAGMVLYLDGSAVATGTTTTALTFGSGGYWRVGGGSSFASASAYLAATIDETAVYSYALSAAQVATHWTTSGVANKAPTAVFSSTVADRTVSFDATSSRDPDGTIASYAWDFGDGTTGTGVRPVHTYATPGSYIVRLVVTDNSGATDSLSQAVTTNRPPTASFVTTRDSLSVATDGRASSDADGTVTGYRWDFGDGTAATTGATSGHTYRTGGTYTVTLTVTDDAGATDTTTRTVTVAVNAAPVPDFTVTGGTGNTFAFDASGSSDPDGSIASYAWAFGDNTTAASASPSHTYAAPGRYTVALTVTDNLGTSATVTRTVTAGDLAADSFTRTGTGGWGTADTGGAWTPSTASAFATTGTAGTMTLTAGSTRSIALNAVSSSDTDLRVSVSTDKLAVGGSTYVSVIGRKVAGQGDYRVKLNLAANGAVTAQLVRTNSAGTETGLGAAQTISGLTNSAGAVLLVRLRVTGSGTTTVSAKVWAQGQGEPSAWAVSTTDTTAGLQAAGGVGLLGYLSSGATNAPVTVTVDNLRATSSTLTANQPPAAAFAATVADRTVSVDASASSDSDGTIGGYSWDFGDGGTATGSTATHVYATTGSYTVTLTVTDNGGATSVATRTVRTNRPPVAVASATTSYLTATLDGSASADPDGTVTAYAWHFGDGATSSQRTPSHTYAADGTYSVTLTVTDDAGATDVTTLSVTVAADVPPVAAFVASPDERTVTLDASGSSDRDGRITGYAWNFGDGTTGAGVTTTHTYTSSGTFTVTLVVTDDAGRTDTTSQSVLINRSPVPSFTVTKNYLSLSVDGTASSDPDGTITGYAWDFGDGSGESGATASHTYGSNGTYTVSLAVTDDSGVTVVSSKTVTIAGNAAPIGSFTVKVDDRTVSTDASASLDQDGTITSYGWDWGDNTVGSGATASHTYATAGTYTVTLTLTDDAGATSTVTRSVSTNQPPTAAFTLAQNYLTVTATNASTDPDGTIASVAWDFGDGSTSTAGSPSHTYAAPGTYSVTLRVTDNNGATDTTVRAVTVSANRTPTAAFTTTVSGATVAFDASGSADADGTIRSYAWDFGDGTSATGATVSHTYTVAGSYAVVLTVTDDGGAAASTTRTVVTTVGATTVVANDTYSRTTASGWGTSDVGGAWTVSTASSFAVNGSAGVLTVPTAGTTRSAYLNSVSSSNTDLRLQVAMNKLPTGGSAYFTVSGRKTSQGEYRAKVLVSAAGAVSVQLVRATAAGAETVIATAATVTGLTYTANAKLQVRLQVFGTSPTTVRAKVWAATGTEPTAWRVSATDSTSGLQAAGGLGVLGYLSSAVTNAPVAFTVDNLQATVVGANQPPVAAFTPAVTGATANLDASASSDADGTVASWSWTFGDGTAGSGVTASHTYAAGGTYPVTLTVTDDSGATATVTKNVTVTASDAIAADDFGRTVSSGWGSSDTGGAWTVSSASSFAVAGSAGTMTLPAAGNTRTAYLNSVSSTSTDVQVSVALNKMPTGSGTYVSLVGRKVGSSGEYRAKLQISSAGAVTLILVRTSSSGAETVIASSAVAGLTYTANAVLKLRLQVFGTAGTTVQARVWNATQAEPSTWTAKTTDTTAALQAAGGIGLIGYIASSATNAPVVLSFSGLRAVKAG